MKINNIGPSTLINTYNDNKRKITKSDSVGKTDSLQISSAGRSLSNISNDKSRITTPEKVAEIKNQIDQGTYKPNAKQIAQKMIDIIAGREA